MANFREEMRAVRSASATRRVVAALVARGVLESDGPRATVRLAFPAALVPRWMPGLFPERNEENS